MFMQLWEAKTRGGAHHKALGDGVADVDLAAVGGDRAHEQAEGRLAPAQHRLAAVAHVQVRQLRHAPLRRRARNPRFTPCTRSQQIHWVRCFVGGSQHEEPCHGVKGITASVKQQV